MFSLLWSEHCAYKHSKQLLQARCPPRAATSSWARARTRARSTSAAGWPSPSRSSRTTTPARSSPSRAPPPASAGSCATSSRSARGRSRCSTRCASASPTRRSARATCSTAPWPASGTTATRSACRRSAARSTSRRPTSRTASSTRWRSAWPRRERMIRSAAAGVGNVVVLFGASTGRDGIGGASVLASAELGEADDDKRPTVQVGDPFAEKKLMECSLELLERGLLVSLQDLGAAGLTSSASEMASKGGVGHRPRRRARAAARGRHGALRDHGLRVAGADAVRLRARARSTRCSRSARRWEVHGTAIGEVTDTGAMRIFRGDELVGDMPVAALVDDCPLYDLAPAAPGGAALRRRPRRRSPRGGSVHEALLALLASPNLASRRPLFEQYDWIVQSRTVRRPEEADAAVLALPDGGGARRVDRRQRPPRRRRPLPAARSRRCSSARRTSPASAPSRSA